MVFDNPYANYNCSENKCISFVYTNNELHVNIFCQTSYVLKK